MRIWGWTMVRASVFILIALLSAGQSFAQTASLTERLNICLQAVVAHDVTIIDEKDVSFFGGDLQISFGSAGEDRINRSFWEDTGAYSQRHTFAFVVRYFSRDPRPESQCLVYLTPDDDVESAISALRAKLTAEYGQIMGRDQSIDFTDRYQVCRKNRLPIYVSEGMRSISISDVGFTGFIC